MELFLAPSKTQSKPNHLDLSKPFGAKVVLLQVKYSKITIRPKRHVQVQPSIINPMPTKIHQNPICWKETPGPTIGLHASPMAFGVQVFNCFFAKIHLRDNHSRNKKRFDLWLFNIHILATYFLQISSHPPVLPGQSIPRDPGSWNWIGTSRRHA